jgi:serine protease
MKRWVLFAFLIALPAAVFAETTQRYIVVTRHPYAQAARALRNDNFDPTARRDVAEFHIINAFAADLSDAEVAALKRSPEVEWVEPVFERHVLDDTIQQGQQTIPYGVNMVNAPAVWPVTRGKGTDGRPIHVAVIDTGVDRNSPELKRAYKGGYNFVSSNSDPQDDYGHGTHVAGTIAADDDNAGIVGVASDVDLFAVKVLNQCGSGSTDTILNGVQWVVDQKNSVGGDWVVNMSLGGPEFSAAEQAAYQAASDAGVLIFAAAGNSYIDNPVDGLSYPAGYPSVISVGAVDSAMRIASFSQRGPDLKVVAPGVAVLSTVVAEQVSTADGQAFPGEQMAASKRNGDSFCLPRPALTGTLVDCGHGLSSEFPSSVVGNVALIERGGTDLLGTTLTFATKAKNAKAAGATAAIIYNNVDGSFSGTVGTLNSVSDVPLTLSMARTDGLALKGKLGTSVTIDFGLESFALDSGTSMATPHAVAVAALAWAVAPNAPASAVRDAVINTAKDLGDPGVDNVYGHGLVNALDAAKQLNAAAFGTPVGPQPPGPRSGRSPGRRGH